MRPRQWVKNVFVLPALLFSKHVFEGAYLERCIGAVLCFCLLSGVVYLFNDIFDREQDRLHPEKCHRPIAAGKVALPLAWVAASVQPGCLGVDAVWQLIGLYCGLRGGTGSGRALGCKEVEFSGQIRPYDSVVRYEVTIRRYTQLKGGGTSVAIGTGRVLVDGEHIYTIKDAKVGLFDGIAYPDYPRRSANSTGGIMER